MLKVSYKQLNHNQNEDYLIFGGTFDPIHEGHLEAIERLSKKFTNILIAPTTTNPWKPDKPSELKYRLAMIRLALEAKNLHFTEDADANGLVVCNYKYVYSKDLVKYLRNLRTGNAIWAISEDLGTSYTKWKDWDSLNLSMLTLPVNIDIHSKDIRNKQKLPLPAINDYINDNKLY